jgi:hypothetical protein
VSITFKRWGQSELLPRYIFAESIIKHQRILEIGAVASTEGMSAYCLLLKGARSIVACDSALEATQLAQAKLGAPNLAFRPMVFDGLAPASFDLIAIADLAPFIKAPTFFDQLLRLLTPRGYVLGALRNTAGLALSKVVDADPEEPPPSYGQLLDVLKPRFSSIQAATQVPVLGYQLAFDEGEGLHIEGSLANVGEAAYYIVIAGAEPCMGLDPLWVQLPPEPLFLNRSKLEEATLRARDWQTRFEDQKEVFSRAKVRLEMLEQENQRQLQQLGETQEALTRLQAEAAPETPVFDLAANLELSEKVSRLSADLGVTEGRANAAEARVSAMSMEIQRHVQALREATTDVLSAKESVRIEREKREEAEAKAKEAMGRLTHIQEQATQAEPFSTDSMEVEKAKQEVALQKATIETLRRELEALKEKHLRVVNMQNESGSAAAEKESLQKKLQEQERAVRMLQSDLYAMRAERDALASQPRVPSSEEGEGKGVLEAAAKEALREAPKGVSQAELLRIQELESKLSQKSDEVEALREDLALRSHSVERSKNRIRELESMLANAQTQSKEDSALMGAEYDKLKQDNTTLRSMLESLRAKVEAQRAEETTVDAHTAGTMLAVLRKRYAEQEQTLTQTRESLERTEGELAVVHKQLRKLSRGRDEVTKVARLKGGISNATEYIEEISEIEDIEEVEPEKEK